MLTCQLHDSWFRFYIQIDGMDELLCVSVLLALNLFIYVAPVFLFLFM